MVSSALFLILAGMTVHAHSGRQTPTVTQNYDLKRCQPKLVGRSFRADQIALHQRRKERSTGFPIIAYQILELGEIAHAQVKRSSGVSDIDSYALKSIQSMRYNPRSGCGIIDVEANVLIHHR
jgi:TonB family protein